MLCSSWLPPASSKANRMSQRNPLETCSCQHICRLLQIAIACLQLRHKCPVTASSHLVLHSSSSDLVGKQASAGSSTSWSKLAGQAMSAASAGR